MKTYYVSPYGNDRDLGTLELPFQTIQKAADIVKPGDTVYIRGGVYREKVVLKNSGTADAPITFAAYQDEKVALHNTKLLTPEKNGVGQWQPHGLHNGETIYKIQLPSEWDRGAGNNQLFVSGQAIAETRLFRGQPLKLDQAETEWFLDRKGQYGPANTLYLSSPGGPPANKTIEIKAKPFVLFDFADSSYVRIENIEFFGGKVRSWGNNRGLVLKSTAEDGISPLTRGRETIERRGSDRLPDAKIADTAPRKLLLEESDVVVENKALPEADYAVASAVQDSVLPEASYAVASAVQDNGTAAKSIFVSPNGNDKNNGTFGQPFRTIQKAAELAQPGDTVYIRGGVYRERVRPVNSGNPGAPITYKAYENEKVTVSGTRELTPGKNGLSQWQPHKLPNGKTIHKIQLPEKWSRFDDGRNQVFVNGQMMTEARWPNVPDPVELERDDYAISTDGFVGSKRSNGLFNATYNHPGIESFWKGGYIGFNAGAEWIGSSSRVLGASKGKVNFETRIPSAGGPFVENPYSPTADDPFYLWGKLEALDTAEEWFIDKEGEYGPANMLYLWSPDGNPANQNVELRARFDVWDFTDRDYIRVEDLNFSTGRVRSAAGSKNLVLDGIISEYGEHTLAAGGDPAIRLQGSNHKLLNSEISKTALTGVIVQGDDHLVQNNIVRDVGYGIHIIGDGIRVINGTGTDILHNTVYNIGDRGIFFSGLKDGKIKYNDVFEAGKQRTDLAGIETYGGGDGQGTEIAYNWVHDIEPVKNLESQHFGGQGIRLDPSNKGTSNYKIHHNLVWDTSSGQSIEVWSLKPNMPNYGNSGIDIYNNTVESDIRLFGAKGTSHGGTTVKNNIAGRTNTAGGSEEGNAFENNLEASENPQLVNPKKNDFRLQPSSPAIDAAKPIAGVSNNVPDGKPDVGALEFGQAPFKVGQGSQGNQPNNQGNQDGPDDNSGNSGGGNGGSGNKTFELKAGEGTNTIANFGGVGTGTSISQAEINEVDILKFSGARLSPENLLLSQKGSDLELAFEGVDIKVILPNFALQNLENLPEETSLGNILFDGQQKIEDSFDVFNANSNQSRIFNRDTTTFLNSLNNNVRGLEDSDDVINGQGGNDTLIGLSGSDILRGEDGNDLLDGGVGDDGLHGGAGADKFVLRRTQGSDTIFDYKDGTDSFLLSGGLDFGQLEVTQGKNATLIKVASTGELLASLTQVLANSVKESDFNSIA